jgi:hypothetical protein
MFGSWPTSALRDGHPTNATARGKGAERIRTGNFRWPPQAILPVPYSRLKGSAIAIWWGFPSKLDKSHLAPANYYRTS